ncbi:class B sortase [Ruminococcus sp.]|uniref:class B sortase n=1 Tax=Ruminococcus sp. TaxID=41978 RepID=UPI0025F9C1A6|nr:class B sortase [Ruminococcus sp.]MBQ8967331.1 class B sortase [Ruminococcus sp.]
MAMSKETSDFSERETSNPVVSFIKYFIPWKGDKSSEVVRKAVFMASVVLFVMSVGQLRDYLGTSGEGERSYIQGVVEQYEPQFDDSVEYEVNTGNKDIDISTPEDTHKKREVQKWAKELLDRNKDVVGWIKIPGFTDYYDDEFINFPVLQGKDNDEYLYKDLDRNYYESGSIFADAWSTMNEDGQTDNITIFGHHMGWVGTSFTHLSEYEQGVDFLKEHPIIEFNTVYESGCKYAIVSCFMINTNASDDNGSLWEYIGYRDFNEDYKFDDWYNEITRRSWYANDSIRCTEDDKYITLSTCSKLLDDMRWVIVAKKLTSDDDVKLITESYKAKADDDIYLPQAWVDTYGNTTVYNGWEY